VKEAINNGLQKEVEELAKIMPRDLAQNMAGFMK